MRPVVQTQDLTVFNVTEDAVVARQRRSSPAPSRRRRPEKSLSASPAQPDWWAEALIPLDDVDALPNALRDAVA